MKFRPCIDIHKGKVKQIIGSTLGEKVEVNFESSKSGLIFANLFAQHDFSNGHICVLDKQNESIELAKKIINITNSKSKIIFKPLPQDDPKQRRPDISKAKKYLNWLPNVKLKKV